jgi:menaquinone-9 beta-reductase
MSDYEAIVVGGGPAGSSVAAELARLGRKVLLLDKASFPRHKACSEYVNAGGVQLLRDLGLESELLVAGAHRMTAMRVVAPNGCHFLASFERAEPGRYALGLSRYRLDAILLDHARANGAEVCERAHVRALVTNDHRVEGVLVTIDGQREEIRAPLVIGADGRHSIVARELNVARSPRWPRKTGLVAHYQGVEGLDQFGEMHAGRGVYVGLAPLECGLTNVAVVATNDAVNGRVGSVEDFFAGVLANFPAVAAKLNSASRVGTIRGVGAMAHRAERTVRDGTLLIGDAASFLDPFTGEGIYEALKGAQLAAPVVNRAILAGDLSAAALRPYMVARRGTFTAKRQVGLIVQAIINTPTLMNYVTPRLASRDDVGNTLAAVLGNFAPAGRALSPRFLAQLLRP